MVDPERTGDPVTIGLVAHYAFCPRRAWLEAAGERTETHQMAIGISSHRRTDDPRTSRSGHHRAVDVLNDEWGYYGRCDTVTGPEDGTVEVVEYKATPVRRRAEITEPMRVQLALQVAALRSMGYQVSGQGIYFTEHQQRVPVNLVQPDFDRARDLVTRTRLTLESTTAPPPLIDDSRCFRCSHVSVCLPDERRMTGVTRRILVADPDAQVVHLMTPGSRAFVRSGRLVAQKADEDLASVPLERVQGLVVHGNVDISGALIREVLWRSLTIVWCSSSGRVIGWASPADGPNGAGRIEQHVSAAAGRLDLSREFVGAKIANQATMLRRNGKDPAAASALRQLAWCTRTAKSNPELFGIEGEAAAIYFASFASMLRSDGVGFTVRTRRPAADRSTHA